MSAESRYAMYVIGTVESNCNWSAVNYNDPITLGMMQWYGNRAYELLNRGRSADPQGWEAFRSAAPALAGQVETNSTRWTTRYLNRVEGNAWVAWSQRKENHAFQEAQWDDDFQAYSDTCDKYGFPGANVRERIFFMSMYHQSPVSALRVLGSVSASATLDLLHSAALNDGILGQYRTRYDRAYTMLRNWDGVSEPPDFGQSGSVNDSQGGNAPTISGTPDSTAWINVQQDTIYMHEKNRVRTFYHSTAQNWMEKFEKGVPVNTGQQTNPGNDTGTGAASKVVDWVRQRVNKYAYSQGAGRLNPESTGYTDCSGLWWRAYMDVTGVDVGTWTGQQATKGSLVADSSNEDIRQAISKVRAGDLLLLGGRPNFDHVEGFVSNGSAQTLSHGGPGNGPNYFDAVTEAAYFGGSWQIRRYV
ncbi:MAG: hypothetical protein [Caudoviricetes sp.]|nr:MAG: hypothetical protein [Caudoviricetes sp.]